MKTKQLSERTINAIEPVISGNSTPAGANLAPYRTGPELVAFFNQFARNDTYGAGFPSRSTYVKDCLRTARPEIQIQIVQAALDPAYFLEFEGNEAAAVEHLNKYLKFESLQIRKWRQGYKVTAINDSIVEFENAHFSKDALSQEFIDEQIYKCRSKISSEDYDGAITNARSLVEAVFREIVSQLSTAGSAEDELPKQYKQVRELLNLDPNRTDISDSVKQVLIGLTNIVTGLAPIRNRMSDAHARSYKPQRHHAKLAVNSAQTIADFLIDSFRFQLASGIIKLNVKAMLDQV